MADILTFILDKVALPVLSGAGGVGASIWRMSVTLSNRIEKLEASWILFTEKDYPKDKSDFTAALHQLHQFILKELQDLRNDSKNGARERSDARRLSTSLVDRLVQLEHQLAECSKAVDTLEEQLRQFMKEQHDQWQDMTRTLGQIEGYLRGVTRGSSGIDPFKKSP